MFIFADEELNPMENGGTEFVTPGVFIDPEH